MPPKPSFDTWTIIFLFAAAQGYFTALVLFRWRRGNRPGNRLLALLLFLFAFTLTEYVLYWTRYIGWVPHLSEASACFPLLFGPLIWLYLRTIYENRPLGRRDAWHLLPFLLASAAFLPWYALDGASKILVWQHKQPNPIPGEAIRVVLWLRILHMVAYLAWNFRYIRRQSRVGDSRRWAMLLNGFFAGFALSYSAYFVLVQFPFFNAAWDYHISAAMTAFIYLIAYAGYVQPAVFAGFDCLEAATPVKYRNSGLTPEASRSLAQRLVEFMENEKRYRDPELNLDTLAEQLNASKHHVSQVINEHLGASFFEYVNQLRIAEARRLLTETRRSDLHVIEAAYAVGFSNKVSFNAAFKKATGMTPTEYRKSHGKTDPELQQPGGAG